MDLSKYNNKKLKKRNLIIKSITIRPDQELFLKENNIVFSELVRDLLDDVIEKNKDKKAV